MNNFPDNQAAGPVRSTLAAFLAEAGDRTRLLTLTDQAVVSVASFATSIIIGRLCGKEQLGLYLLSLTIIGVVMEFQEVLIWSPYTFFSSRLAGLELKFYTGAALLHQLAFSLFSLPLLWALSGMLSRGAGPAGLEPILWTLILVGTFIYFQEFSRRVCFAGLAMQAALGFDLAAAAVRLGGLVLLAWLGGLSAARALAVIGLAGALAGVLWLIWARQLLAFSLPGAIGSFRQNWSFGRWVLGSNLALNVSTWAFPWLLATFHDLQVVGILAACQSVIALVNPFLVGSRNFLAPKAAQVFAAGDAREVHRFVRTNTLIVAGAISLLCLGIMGFGKELLHLLYGSQFGDQGLVIALLAANAILGALPLVVDYGIWAMGRPDINFKINSLRLAATVTVGALLVSRLDLVGAALGLLLNSGIVLALQTLCYLKLARSKI